MLTRSTPLFLRGDLGCKHVVLFIRPFFSEFSVYSVVMYNITHNVCQLGVTALKRNQRSAHSLNGTRLSRMAVVLEVA